MKETSLATPMAEHVIFFKRVSISNMGLFYDDQPKMINHLSYSRKNQHSRSVIVTLAYKVNYPITD